jgi:ubiquinone biosynthesis protein UbiJ
VETCIPDSTLDSIAFGRHIVAMDPELAQALATLEQRLEQKLEQKLVGEIRASEARMREHVAETVRASADETRRHAAILAEGLRADFRIATEVISPLGRRVDALEDHDAHTTRRVDMLERRVSMIERVGKTRRPRGR